jgi:murein DD-endopeptidase MepM/ murein hydrolase activator NlpD
MVRSAALRRVGGLAVLWLLALPVCLPAAQAAAAAGQPVAGQPVAGQPAPAQPVDPAAEAARLDAERREAERAEAERLEAERKARAESEAARQQALAERLRFARNDLSRSEAEILAALGARNLATGNAVVAGFDLEDARDAVVAAEQALDEAERAVRAAEGAQRRTQRDLEVAQERLGEQVARAYRAGSSGSNGYIVAADALLQTRSPSQFVHGMGYLESAVGTRADRVRTAEVERDAAAAELEIAREALAAATEAVPEAEDARAEAERVHAAALAAVPAAQRRLDAAVADHRRRASELATYAAGERTATSAGDEHPSRTRNLELTSELAGLATSATAAADRIVRGSARIVAGAEGVRPWRELECPVDGAIRYVNDWGFPRTGGRSHEGTDIFADTGTPIVAMAGGVVRKVSRQEVGLGGRTVTYEIDGYRVYNAHLDEVAEGLQPGDEVTAGQVIGTVGNTGNARTTPPHNHFGVYRSDGAPLNPYPLLRMACD